MSGTEIPDNPSSEFKLVALRLEVLHGDVSDMKAVLRDLTQAITKLALIEERQAQVGHAMDRAFKTLEKLEERVTDLERSKPLTDQTNQWVKNIGYAAVGLIVALVLSKLHLLPGVTG